MKSSIVKFHLDFYIPAIQKLVFNLTHVRIIGTHHWGNTRQEAFNICSDFQDMLCRRYYIEHVVTIFSHQIQYE